METDSSNNPGKPFSEKLNLLVPFLIYFISYLLLLAPVAPAIIPYTISYISASFMFIFICFFIYNKNPDSRDIYFLIIISFVIRISAVFIPPAGSDDYYRYVWDGKVLADGINPYQYAPSDTALNHLHSEKLPSLVKFPEIKTVYPPAAEIFFYLSYQIGGETFYGIKFLLLIFEFLSLLVFRSLLKKLQLPPKNILYYALCPLPVFQLFIDAHVDGFGTSLLLLFILFYLNEKYLLSFIFLGLSISVKPLGLILIPLIFFAEQGSYRKILAASVPLIMTAILYFFFSFSANPLEALGTFAANWTFNGFIFNLIDSFIVDNQKSRLICGILLIIFLIPVIFLKTGFIKKIYYSVFILLIFSPIVHPWYIMWLAVLLPITARFSGFSYCGLISLTALTILNYQIYGIWNDYPLVWFLEYLPVLFFFILELRQDSGTKKHFKFT